MKINIYFLIVTICFLILTLENFGIDIPKTPFLKNYSKRDYGARTQNWAAIQDNNNIMYFANNDGVLQFDGVNWDKIQMPNKSIVRSLYYLGGDTIMAGAYSEFGMIYHDKKGLLVYDSWHHKIPAEYKDFGEVWRIHKLGERLIVQSFSHLFIFESGNFIKAILPEKGFMFSFINNGTLFIQQPGSGLFKLVNNELVLVDSSTVFRDMEVWAFLPFDGNRFIVGTQFNGLYLYDGLQITPWISEANDFIKKNNLFSAVAMKNGNYAFGSIQNGLVIVNKSGKILSLENMAVGLQNNTVLSLFEDNSQNLWLGLDNGIDYLKSNSPLSYVRKRGGFGTGYTSIIFNNNLYAGTNQGLFYIPLNSSGEKNGSITDFELIESTRGQVWCLKSFEGKLFCGHNAGLFIINNDEAIQIENIAGVWDIAEIPNDEINLLIGTYQGFYLFNKQTNGLHKLNGFDESARRILFYNDSCLIINHGYKGIFDIRIDVKNKFADVLHFYDGSKYLPNKVGNDVFRFNNDLIVATDSGVFNFKNNQFTHLPFWNDVFDGNANRISNIIDIGGSKFWCFKEGQISLLTYLNEKMYDLNKRDFLSISNTFPTSFENVLKINDESFLIGTEDGYVLYEAKSTEIVNEKISIDVSSIQFKYKGENSYNSLEFKKNNNEIELQKINYSQHRLKINLAIPFYAAQNLVHYRYRINSGPWLEWVTGNELKLDDLREGSYFIDLQCSIDKKDISGELLIKFTIEPPFFRRWYSYVFYLFLFFSSALLSSKLIKKRIENEKRRESLKQQKQMIEKQIKFEREAELAQNELINLRNERLKTDIRHKSKELANTTMSLINKNKILQQFKDVLTDLRKEDVKYRENPKLNSLIKKINKEIEHQDNWVVFEKNFDKVHENFLQRLKGKHHDLTPKDLRLAAYLRMNLSSKEIAPLLNISIRSVEISRYRLRKKMNLEHDENLTEYLIST